MIVQMCQPSSAILAACIMIILFAYSRKPSSQSSRKDPRNGSLKACRSGFEDGLKMVVHAGVCWAVLGCGGAVATCEPSGRLAAATAARRCRHTQSLQCLRQVATADLHRTKDRESSSLVRRQWQTGRQETERRQGSAKKDCTTSMPSNSETNGCLQWDATGRCKGERRNKRWEKSEAGDNLVSDIVHILVADFWQAGGGILKDWLIRHSSWKLPSPFFPSTVMSQPPTRCTLYLHQKSPTPGRFYNQFANLKRNFLIDFSIQKLSVGIGDFHLKPSLWDVKLFRKFIKYSSKRNLSISLPALRLQARWSIKCCKPLTPTHHLHYWQIQVKTCIYIIGRSKQKITQNFIRGYTHREKEY